MFLRWEPSSLQALSVTASLGRRNLPTLCLPCAVGANCREVLALQFKGSAG